MHFRLGTDDDGTAVEAHDLPAQAQADARAFLLGRIEGDEDLVEAFARVVGARQVL